MLWTTRARHADEGLDELYIYSPSSVAPPDLGPGPENSPQVCGLHRQRGHRCRNAYPRESGQQVEALGGAPAQSGEVLGPGNKMPARGIGFPTFAENPGCFADANDAEVADW